MRQAYQTWSQCSVQKMPLDFRFLLELARSRNQLMHALVGNGMQPQRLHALLQNHGVPEMKVAQRVKMISEKISQDKIRLALDQSDEQQQWRYLKQEANAVNLRLLDRDESEAYHKRKFVNALTNSDVDHLQIDDPWSSKPAKVSPSSSKRSPPPLIEARLRPEDWLDESGAPVAVLASADVKSTASGVAAVDLDTATRLLAHSTKAWTLGPLTLFVTSDSSPDTPLPCEELTILMNVSSGPVVRVRGSGSTWCCACQASYLHTGGFAKT